jgi:hypothetical protein
MVPAEPANVTRQIRDKAAANLNLKDSTSSILYISKYKSCISDTPNRFIHHVRPRESSLQLEGQFWRLSWLLCQSAASQPHATAHQVPPTHTLMLTDPPQFTAKQLNRQAAKAGKDEKTEKDKLKKVSCLQPKSERGTNNDRQSNKATVISRRFTHRTQSGSKTKDLIFSD